MHTNNSLTFTRTNKNKDNGRSKVRYIRTMTIEDAT